MQENMKEYLTEKEAREKRLEVYTEKIQEKVLSRSSETIRQLVEERHRQKMTQQEIADITGIKPSNKPHWGQTPLLLWETFGRFLFFGLKFEKSLYNLNAMEKVFIRF